MNDTSDGYVIVADVVRSGFAEGAHFGRVVGVRADGTTQIALGDVKQAIHPRSANKLMQAAGMLTLGLDLSDERLALAAASHWGQSKHVDGVRAILADVGLDEATLGCTPSLPEDASARRTAIMSGEVPRAVYSGCSGKHAAMLRTCVQNGWSIDDYLEPNHPLQESLYNYVEECTRTRITHTAIDGCGAPAWAMPLTTLVDVYRGAATSVASSPLTQVADAMRAYPDFVCGDESEVTGLMRAVPGLLAKDGAESVYVAALPDGRAVGIKIADGGFRAGQAVLVAALVELGVAKLPDVDQPALTRLGTVSVEGHGEPVGVIAPRLGKQPV